MSESRAAFRNSFNAFDGSLGVANPPPVQRLNKLLVRAQLAQTVPLRSIRAESACAIPRAIYRRLLRKTPVALVAGRFALLSDASLDRH